MVRSGKRNKGFHDCTAQANQPGVILAASDSEGINGPRRAQDSQSRWRPDHHEQTIPMPTTNCHYRDLGVEQAAAEYRRLLCWWPRI